MLLGEVRATATDHGEAIDRRDALRRRIYLALLAVGIPALAVTWWVHRSSDPFIAVAFPLKVVAQTWVAVGLYRGTLAVRTAERVILVLVITVYMGGFAVDVLGADGPTSVHEPTSVFSLLTINMMAMLAYVAFDTRRALQVSLGVVGTFAAVIALRVLPDILAGSVDTTAVDHLRSLLFLGASVGLLHVLAQTKEQAAEARSAAAAMAALANTDVLTGLPNRRHLHHILEGYVADLAAVHPLAVALLDVDHFKRVNDEHGHDAGDAALRGVAAVLQASVREGDVVGRWGGEEFLVLAPHTTPDAARALAERCRGRIAAAHLPHVGTLTSSLGVAVARPGDSAWDVLRRADDALYVAKRTGRDRVHQDDPHSDTVEPVGAPVER
jgi:diguanylate cyclase (GGDEF)-like protein